MVTIKKGSGKSTTYGGDGKVLFESISGGNNSSNVILSADSKRILYSSKDKDKELTNK